MAKLVLKIRILDENGKVELERESHSFVKQFLQWLEFMFGNHNYNAGLVAVTLLDTGNTSRAIGAVARYMQYFSVLGVAASNTYGIVVGTGTNAETASDVALQTIVAHGTGGGQLSYGAQGYTTATVAGSDITLIWTRTFTNGSGGNITINEIGIYSTGNDDGNTQRYFCLVRDKLDSGVTINNGSNKTVQYTLTTTN